MTAQQANQSKPSDETEKTARAGISLDAWAVTLAFAVSLLIWTGVIKHVPW
jgi:hypothetical protein